MSGIRLYNKKGRERKMNVNILDGKYTIKDDGECYAIYLNTPKKQKEGFNTKTLGYTDSVVQCLQIAIEYEQRKNNCKTLEGYIKHCKAVNKRFEEAILELYNILGGKGTVSRVIQNLDKRVQKELENE